MEKQSSDPPDIIFVSVIVLQIYKNLPMLNNSNNLEQEQDTTGPTIIALIFEEPCPLVNQLLFDTGLFCHWPCLRGHGVSWQCG